MSFFLLYDFSFCPWLHFYLLNVDFFRSFAIPLHYEQIFTPFSTLMCDNPIFLLYGFILLTILSCFALLRFLLSSLLHPVFFMSGLLCLHNTLITLYYFVFFFVRGGSFVSFNFEYLFYRVSKFLFF